MMLKQFRLNSVYTYKFILETLCGELIAGIHGLPLFGQIFWMHLETLSIWVYIEHRVFDLSNMRKIKEDIYTVRNNTALKP